MARCWPDDRYSAATTRQAGHDHDRARRRPPGRPQRAADAARGRGRHRGRRRGRRRGRDAQRYVLGHKPTVLVLDLNMPGGSSLEAIPTIAETSPDTSVVVLTMQEDPAFAREALQAGARGYVLKQAAGTELVQAIRAAAGGGTWLNPELGARMAAAPLTPAGPPGDLTEREIEVLRLIALGHTNNEIAEQLYLSVRTVETHRAHIQQKLGLSTPGRAGALRARQRADRALATPWTWRARARGRRHSARDRTRRGTGLHARREQRAPATLSLGPDRRPHGRRVGRRDVASRAQRGQRGEAGLGLASAGRSCWPPGGCSSGETCTWPGCGAPGCAARCSCSGSCWCTACPRDLRSARRSRRTARGWRCS